MEVDRPDRLQWQVKDLAQIRAIEDLVERLLEAESISVVPKAHIHVSHSYAAMEEPCYSSHFSP
jgi:hypothetical protein